MAEKTVKTATYKGATYQLLWIGDTKYGKRAKLGFMDGTNYFWVPAALVTVGGSVSPAATNPTKRQPRKNRLSEDDACELCGKNKFTCGHCIGW